MLKLAPKGRIAPTRILSRGDDRLLREAFGRYGGTAVARADAVDVVRRAQIEAGGSWFLCDCRPGLERPPALCLSSRPISGGTRRPGGRCTLRLASSSANRPSRRVGDRLLLLDSDLERATLDLLLAFRARMAARSGIAVAIDKPLHDLPPRERRARRLDRRSSRTLW